MAKVTKDGQKLREELNRAYRSNGSDHYIPLLTFDEELSLLLRRARRYTKRQEDACNYANCCGPEWEAADTRLEEAITDVAMKIPGVTGVRFGGDPRGYVVSLFLANGASNSWGGPECGWGIG